MIKIGSLVVVLPLMPGETLRTDVKFDWLPVSDGETIYTVRKIDTCTSKTKVVMFEEGVIGFNPHGLGDGELGVPIKQVKEIQPPMEIKIEEFLTETV